MRHLMFASRWMVIGSLLSIVAMHLLEPELQIGWLMWLWLVVTFTVMTASTLIVVLRDIRKGPGR